VNALLSSGLLAAGLFVGQTGEPPIGTKVVPAAPVIQQVQAQQPQQPSRPIMGWFSRDDRPIMSKISNWWKREPKDVVPNNYPGRDQDIRTTPATPVSKPATPTVPANDFPRKLPNPQSLGAKPTTPVAKEAATAKPDVQQTTLQQVAPPKNTKYPILPELTNKIGRDEKFEWVTGQLEIENGNLVLYYATPETVDKYHGRIVLLPQQVEMGQYKKGDLISVRGQVVQRQSMQGIVPIYRVSHASLIERPKS